MPKICITFCMETWIIFAWSNRFWIWLPLNWRHSKIMLPYLDFQIFTDNRLLATSEPFFSHSCRKVIECHASSQSLLTLYCEDAAMHALQKPVCLCRHFEGLLNPFGHVVRLLSSDLWTGIKWGIHQFYAHVELEFAVKFCSLERVNFQNVQFLCVMKVCFVVK